LDHIIAGNIAVAGAHATDCALVVLSHWTMDYKGTLTAFRTKMMIDDCTLRSTNFALGQFPWGEGGASGLQASESDIVISRSSLAGASATRDTDANGTPYYLNAHPAIRTCKSTFRIGKGCTLEAGSYYFGGVTDINELVCNNVAPPHDCPMAIDPSTVLVGPLVNDTTFHYDFSPQTGISYQVSPTTLTVTHDATPQSLCILGIGALTTTPWTNLVGPVFIDPNSASQYWDLAPATGTLLRSFPIPPGLPPGYQAAIQAFELQQSGAIRTSNAGIVAVP
jgi:hypothetical protein